MTSRDLQKECAFSEPDPTCSIGADALGEAPDLDAWTVHDADVLMADVRHGIARESTAKALLAESAAHDPLSHAARVLLQRLVLREAEVLGVHYFVS